MRFYVLERVVVRGRISGHVAATITASNLDMVISLLFAIDTRRPT